MSLKILVVDDSSTTRAVIRKTLDLSGLPISELHEAGDGQEGLKILSDNWIDLVFADINMPIMSGEEMIGKMHEDDLLKTIPVIVVSTEGSNPRVDALKSKGIRAFVRKPFSPEHIREVVTEVLNLKAK